MSFSPTHFEIERRLIYFDKRLKGKALICLPEDLIKRFHLFPAEDILLESGGTKIVLKIGVPLDDSDAVRIDPVYDYVLPTNPNTKIQIKKKIDQILPAKDLRLLIEEQVDKEEVLDLIHSERLFNINAFYTLKGMKFVLSTANTNMEITSVMASRDLITEIITFESLEDWKSKWSDFLNKEKEAKKLEKSIGSLEQELSQKENQLQELCLELQEKVKICEKWEQFFAPLMAACGLYDNKKKNEIVQQIKKQAERYKRFSEQKGEIELQSGKMTFEKIKENLSNIFSLSQTGTDIKREDISTTLKIIVEETEELLRNVCNTN